MDFAYFGYRKWVEDILKNLKPKNHKIDSYTIKETEYKEISENIVNPKKLKEVNLKKYDACFFYGWSWLVPEEIFKNHDCICLHPSPLPKYRGGSPLQHQIIAGEKDSAVTLFKISSGLDSGPIYYQEKFSLEGPLSLVFDRIVDVGSKLTLQLIEDYSNNKIKLVEQNELEATTYKRRKPHESELTPQMLKNMTSIEIFNFIRALDDPYPNAYIQSKEGNKIFLKSCSLEKIH